MPSEGRGALGRDRSTVSSRLEARGTPFGGASKRRRGLGSNRFFSSSMPESKDTPFGGQASVANDSGGTALPSPRAWKHGVPPLVVLAKGGGGLGSNRLKTSSMPESQGTPF